MNKFTKRLLALGLALSIVAGAGGISVFAASYTPGYHVNMPFNGTRIIYASALKETSANASTSYIGTGVSGVSSTYTYLNSSTLYMSRITRSNGGSSSTTVNFTAPQNCKSFSLKNYHSVNADGAFWSQSALVDNGGRTFY